MALPTPVAYWPFNEGTGTTAADASGNGHTATIVHGTWHTGALRTFGAAALSDTDGGSVPGATFTPITLGTAHTVACWINGWDGSNSGIVVAHGNLAASQFACYLDATYLIYAVSGSNYVLFAHGGGAGFTGLHHLAVTRSGTTITFYRDGVSLGGGTLGANTAISASSISGHSDGAHPLVATLDDLRIYDVALSGAQVAELFALNPDPPSAFAVVQTATGTSTAAASVAMTFATPPPVGQAVVVVVVGNPAAATVTGVTDTAGSTYTLAKTQLQASNALVTIWSCPVLTATATPFTVTATGASGQARLGVALAVSGVGAGLAVDQTAGTDMGAATVGATTAALTANDVLLVAGCSLAGSTASITVGGVPPPAWVQQAERLALNPVTGEVDTRVVTAATGTTPSVSWALGGALGAASALVAFYSTGPPDDGPPVYVVTIDEIEVVPLLATFRIQETIDAPDTMIADVFTVGTPFARFSLGDAVVVTEDGVRIFGGVVSGTRERGLTGPSATDLVVEIQASSYELNAARRVVTAAFSQGTPAETIGAVFATLVADYYAAVGVTVHPDQVAGPDLPAATFTRSRGDAVNKQLAASVGYLQAIDFENRLRAWAPGDVLAPDNYDESVNPELLVGDISVDRQLQNGYANRVILVGDPITIPDHQDHFTGDGVTDTFPITYQVAGPLPYSPDNAIAYAVVWYPADGSSESIGGAETPPGVDWEYDPIAQTIRRRAGPVGAGVAFYFPYHGLFIPEGMAEDAGEIATYGLWEHVENVTAVITDASAQEYADALLAAKLASKDEIVTLETHALGFHPGQTMTIASFSRELAGEYLISQVDTASDGSTRLRRSITASKSQGNTHDWRRVYQQWAGASAGNSGSGAGSSTSSGAGAGTGLHAATHQLGGFDPIKLDDLATPDDTTDLDATTSEHGLLPKLSGLDVEVLRGDGTWGNSPLTSGVFAYVFNTVTTEPPASQRIRFNAGHPYTAVTKLWADFSSSNSEDLYWGWMRIRVGSLIIVQDKDTHAQFAEFLTTGDPIDKGTYVELPVAWVSNGTALAVQAVLTRVTAPAPGGSGSNAFGTLAVSGQSDVVADAAPDTLTLVAGSGVTITTNATTDSVTIAATGTAGWVLIEEKVCSGSTSTETFSSIPGTYRHLRILFTARVTSTGSGNNDIYVQLNGDTAANYDQQLHVAFATTSAASNLINSSAPMIVQAPQTSAVAGMASVGELVVPYYAGTTFHKTVTAVSTSRNAHTAGGAVVLSTAVHWRNTAAVTSLRLGVATSGNFASGTLISLYGVS